MATTRSRELGAMAVTLEVWQRQIAALQARAMTAGPERQRVMGRQITVLRQRREACKALMVDAGAASVAVLRAMLPGARRIAEQFRRLYLESESRFSD